MILYHPFFMCLIKNIFPISLYNSNDCTKLFTPANCNDHDGPDFIKTICLIKRYWMYCW